MKTFKIIDEVNAMTVARIEARDGKSALKKFMQSRMFSSGMREVHKTALGNWELSTTYGAYFYAVEDC